MINEVNSLRSFLFTEVLSNPKLTLVQGTLNVVINQNVTLSCHSDSGSPPVRYTLFKHSQKVSTSNSSDLTLGLFNLTINSASDLGEYKCKAENNITSGGKYSNSHPYRYVLLYTFSAHLILGAHSHVCTCSRRSQGFVCSR